MGISKPCSHLQPGGADSEGKLKLLKFRPSKQFLTKFGLKK